MDTKRLKPVKEGKVREVYDAGDSMIIVATDRISEIGRASCRERV